jgi:hypothetical protein
VWIDANNCAIYITLVANIPTDTFDHQYEGAEACTMLRALNKANLTTNSLHKRILDRLIADKVLVGAVAGVPE